MAFFYGLFSGQEKGEKTNEFENYTICEGLNSVRASTQKPSFPESISFAESNSIRLRSDEKKRLEKALHAKGLIDWGNDT